ncbi:aldehyde dehydrogenase family protein [Thalassotalea sp. HSM 43]|uniref:aldehyde dehydrogenase family protein n=1 Tax=Thalassotalea sp. HSM 43 TaxID=2552945 RepID=UPI00107FF9F1|nr:aldehyde dehydrogenase family protein [Thalassotalea sp. HSM 43]QBY05882.1 aldehyde dehydrogenase family protein [Thalassotalea sp. HSM 43]
MASCQKLLINGRWVEAHSKTQLDVINPATEKTIASIAIANEQDVNDAVDAAKEAFKTWQYVSSDERGRYIEAIVTKLSEKRADMAATISSELGMPIVLSDMVQTGGPLTGMLPYAALAKSMDTQEHIDNSIVIKQAIGVCALITPWNFPLHQLIAKVAPALAAGCTMVVKPSEETPLNAIMFAEILQQVGLPAGVFNLVTGDGETTGNALTKHPDVDLVSFTGSTSAGVNVALNAAPSVKRVCQELGGKSANIISPTAPLEQAISDAIISVMFNSGQTCVAATRVLVHQSQYQQAVDIAKAVTETLIVGEPDNEQSFIGPLCSAKQQQSVLNYIQTGINEGATLITGGLEKPDGLDKGFYVKPTVFADVENDMVIAQQEIFGPVVCFIAYQDIEHAIRIANDSQYGLAAKVWAETQDQAVDIAKHIRAGQITINGGNFNYNAPFGGFKQSGNGREWGAAGLNEFIELKSMHC